MNFERGNRLYNSGDYKQAIDEYKVAIDNCEEVESSYYNMGISYIKLKEYDMAIKCIKNAVSFSRQSKYFFNIGYCYYNKKDFGSAMFNLIIAYRLDSEDEDLKDAIDVVAKVISEKGKVYED